jgi:hypothetical protein
VRTQPSTRRGVSDEHEAEARRTTFGSQVADAEGPTWKMHHGEFQNRLVDVDSGTVDAIITDPPYSSEALSFWSDLAKEVERVLVSQGRLIALTGQILLPEVMEQLSEHLSYGWTYCQPMPGQNSRIMGRHVMQTWKPWLVYTNGTWPSGWVSATLWPNGAIVCRCDH